jgi:hypothetical protein
MNPVKQILKHFRGELAIVDPAPTPEPTVTGPVRY